MQSTWPKVYYTHFCNKTSSVQGGATACISTRRSHMLHQQEYTATRTTLLLKTKKQWWFRWNNWLSMSVYLIDCCSFKVQRCWIQSSTFHPSNTASIKIQVGNLFAKGKEKVGAGAGYSPGGCSCSGTRRARAATSMGRVTSDLKGSFMLAFADHADHQGPPPTCKQEVLFVQCVINGKIGETC